MSSPSRSMHCYNFDKLCIHRHMATVPPTTRGPMVQQFGTCKESSLLNQYSYGTYQQFLNQLRL